MGVPSYVPPKGEASFAAAGGPVVAQSEGGALGGFTLTDILAGAAHRDLLQRTLTGSGMVSAGVYRTLDAGVSVGNMIHN